MNRSARYSLGTLLFLVVLVSGFYAGRSRGIDVAKSDWVKVPVYTKTYNVGDIVLTDKAAQVQANKSSDQPRPLGGITEADFEVLIDDIERTIFPNVWGTGTETRIRPQVATLSIVVTGNATVHYELEQFLPAAKLNAEEGSSQYTSTDD